MFMSRALVFPQEPRLHVSALFSALAENMVGLGAAKFMIASRFPGQKEEEMLRKSQKGGK